MKEIVHGNATVKLHGTANKDNIKQAAEKFLKKVEAARKRKEQDNERI